MRGSNQKIFLTFFVLSFLFAPISSQAADSQLAWVKTIVAIDTFTGKVVGVSDGDTISVMRGWRVFTKDEVERIREYANKIVPPTS